MKLNDNLTSRFYVCIRDSANALDQAIDLLVTDMINKELTL